MTSKVFIISVIAHFDFEDGELVWIIPPAGHCLHFSPFSPSLCVRFTKPIRCFLYVMTNQCEMV